MTLRPLNDYILGRRLDPEAVTSGGIHIPETAQDDGKGGPGARRAFLGVQVRVVALGPGAWRRKGKIRVRTCPEVKVGDVVVLPKKFAYREVTLDLGDGPQELVVIEEQFLDAMVTPVPPD